MNKFLSRIAKGLLGLSLAAGVGVAVASHKAESVKADTVTIQYSGGTTNMTGNNDAATVGLDALHWSVVGAKGNNSNFPGLNKSGYIAIYYSAGSSNTVTITNLDGDTISSISMTFSGTYSNAKVLVGGSEVTGSSGTYSINASSFVVTNGNTSNVQVRISAIEITYTSSVAPSTKYTVSYYSDGDLFTSQEVYEGTTTSAPTAPSKAGFSFDGWYTDDGSFEDPFDFTSEINSNVDLYAKWVADSADDTVLTFDLSSNPGGWPTTNSTTLTDYTYTLNSVSYTFKLKNVKQNSGYLMLTSVAVLGLPSIEGKKLTKVVASNSGSCSTTTKVGISTSASEGSYVSGGEIQTWATVSSSYTYNLSETEENTVYYMYITNKNCQMTQLVLTYKDAEVTPGTKVKLSAEDVEMFVGDSPVAVTVKNADDSSQVISDCSFSSSNGSVAAVVNGSVVAYSAGTATITVSHADDTTDPLNPISYTSTTFTVTVIEIESIESLVTALKGVTSDATLDGTHTIQGTVTGNYSSSTKKNYMVQQGDFGIYLYNTGVDLNVGEVVRATGQFGRYKNWMESKTLTSVTKVSAAAESITAPVITDLATLTDDYQNRVVTFTGLTYDSGEPGSSDTSINFKLGGATLVLRTTVGIGDETNINAKLAEVKAHKEDSTFNLVGVHYTVFNDAKQFKVDNATKIQIVPNEATVTEIVQGFVDSCMHFEDIPVSEETRKSDTNACSVTGGYYEVAKAGLTALGSEAIAEFQDNDLFNDAQERYESWAEIYGDATPYSPDITPTAGSAHGINASVNSTASTIIIVVVAITSITSIGVLLVIKRRRVHQ